MVVGVDASRAFTDKRTGTENYSWQLLLALAKLECKHNFRIYAKGNSKHEIRSSPPASLRESESGRGKQTLNSSASWWTKQSQFLEFSAFDNFEFKIINCPYFWTQGGLALETWRRPPDLLLVPAHVIPFLKNPRVPTVVTVHDLGFEFLPWYQNPIQRFYLSKIIEKLRAKLVAHIIVVSKSTKKDLVEKLGVPVEKITVVYEGVDLEKFKVEKVKRKYKIEGDYILFVGTIQPRKNIARLIEAFAKLIRGNSRENSHKFAEIQLVLAGKRGWSAEEIYEAPERFGVADRIEFLDYVADEDLPALYAGARVFCLPSLHEGFGLPVLEAMACGTPVVISNTSSLPEVGGDAAVYVNPYDVNSIADGLKKVLSLDTLYKELVEKGLKQAQKFSWENCAKETLAVLERVVNHG